MNKDKIASKLAKLRDEKGISQVEMAKNIGVAQSTYAMYEVGKRMPSDEIKIRIAKYYKKTVQSIFFS